MKYLYELLSLVLQCLPLPIHDGFQFFEMPDTRNEHSSYFYLTSFQRRCLTFKAVLYIRTGFNTDPDPAFYLNADPGPEPGS